MFDDCDCELCGVPATKSLNGQMVCDSCGIEFDETATFAQLAHARGVNTKAREDEAHWLTEVPAGLLGLVDADADDADAMGG
jgi:uncharacterized Zn finger protein (UPF0148 family)